ncbi:VOC family protein [Microvirga flavescens]|uniref:VOC family protein n=1 Tax=Microvirga flavescens TaxID=2249811 RepID=UPI000DD61B17|nr:VOC family protein [Microvirga flavescens]
MTIDMTRRTLLSLAGASSLSVAAVAAARAEGTAAGAASSVAGPTFANRTPMRIGMVTLKVRAIEPTTNFYRDVIGLTVMERSTSGVRLGAGGVPLVNLELRAGAAEESPRAAGLYHTAFLMPTRKDLARWLVHVARNRVPLTGFADHHVSEAVYLDDPEGNGVEVYSDREPDLWRWNAGSVTMGTDHLDVDGLLQLTDPRVSNYAKAPEGLRIGHMHLRVGNLEQADAFYRGIIGLDPTRRGNGAAFLSSGRYHHHLGLNVWQSEGAGKRDEAATGLAWFSLNIETPDLLAMQEERLKKAGVQASSVAEGFEAADPWGTRVRLVKV